MNCRSASGRREGDYVVAVGGASVDICGRSVNGVNRGESNPGSVSVSAGGVARNVAENLARLGWPCRLVSIVGDDSHGEFLLDHCRRCGIDVDDVGRSKDAATSTYLAVIDDSSQLDVAIADMQIMEQLDGKAIERCHDGIREARALFLDANLCADALEKLFSRPGTQPVVADPVSFAKAPRLEPYLSSIDILKPTLAEAAAILRRPPGKRHEAGKLARSLFERGVGEVYLSAGRHGLYVHSAEGAFHLPAPSEPPAGAVTGAGDAMTAAILDARLSGLAVNEAARRGIAAAGVVLSTSAATDSALTRASIEARLEAVAHV